MKTILENELRYYQATSSTAYVAEYEDGQLEIVYNSLSAKEARPGTSFEIVASAKWEDGRGNPHWVVFDGKGEEVAAIATELDGNVTEPYVYYYQ